MLAAFAIEDPCSQHWSWAQLTELPRVPCCCAPLCPKWMSHCYAHLLPGEVPVSPTWLWLHSRSLHAHLDSSSTITASASFSHSQALWSFCSPNPWTSAPYMPTPCILVPPPQWVCLCIHLRNCSCSTCIWAPDPSFMAAPCAPVPQSFVSPLAQVPQILLLSYTHLHATLSAKKDPFGQYFPCRKKKRTRGSQKSLPSKPKQLLTATEDTQSVGCWGLLQSLPMPTSADRAPWRLHCSTLPELRPAAAPSHRARLFIPHPAGAHVSICRWKFFPSKANL